MMDKWKLCRQNFGNEVFNLPEGKDITLGRGQDNVIVLSSLVISRNHCVIKVKDNEVTIVDLKSSNGVYIGLKRIAPNVPYSLTNNDLIGIGWTDGAQLAAIKNSEKYIFKLLSVSHVEPIINRLLYESEDEIPNIRLSLKRKWDGPITKIVKTEQSSDKDQKSSDSENEVVCLLSDSDVLMENGSEIKKKKSNTVKQEYISDIKLENDDLQYEVFAIKQEYLGDNDEPIQVDSDSDSESENWYLRLSQSSPGKPFTKIQKELKTDKRLEENSYSQWDDVQHIDDDDSDIYFQDLINIPLVPPSEVAQCKSTETEIDVTEETKKQSPEHNIKSNEREMIFKSISTENHISKEKKNNHTDSTFSKNITVQEKLPSNDTVIPKKIQMIEPLCRPTVKKGQNSNHETKKKSKDKKPSKHLSKSTRSDICKSQKEQRKKKLQEIACKDKEVDPTNISHTSNKNVVKVKLTNKNRGEFLSNIVQATIKPMKRKSPEKKSKKHSKLPEDSDKSHKKTVHRKQSTNENIPARGESNVINVTEEKTKKTSKTKKKTQETEQLEDSGMVKVIKPLKDVDLGFFGKPVSKVEPLRPKKSVRFSDSAPEVRVFEIESGNKMKTTRLVKTSLVDARHIPVFSLEKITLMKVLRWNPHWLEEQATNTDPPPILGHNNIPLAKFQSYNNHKQYVQLIGDLLLMEIWECLTQAYMRTRNQPKLLHMRIENLSSVPPMERHYELFNLSVNISMPTNEAKGAPRTGEILMVEFGPEQSKSCRFFFVHNVRTLPAPPNNKNTFFSISLYATFTERMRTLKIGELMIGRNLAYINKEIMLFAAMEYLSGSPLCEAILKPEPWHFESHEDDPNVNVDSQWVATLNDSQKKAVVASVSAALGDRPRIQMVQGPPGTGKSSVICAIVMAYFYNANGKKLQNRGKILICATSNAAIDELVTRLLSIRQSLPKPERFKMVRVGRVEAMHSRARDVSSQQLALRDTARVNSEPQHAVVAEQISHLDAKINMWQTAMRDAKDPVRVAYCQGRVSQLSARITLLRSGGGGGEDLRPHRLMAAEKRIIDCADIIATTLSSAQNNKIKGIKGRIALCIVDEAGQAIEPETLVPLTLDVTRLTLVGDPQQLPGFICSQRAKNHGLGESLFARLSSYTDMWPRNPVLLLNQQYRMHPLIADYPNRAFYDGLIATVPRAPIDIDIAPYSIIGISSGDKGQSSSRANEMEACGVSRLAAALCRLTRPRGLSFAVITPYAAHRDLIKKYLQHNGTECPIEVNTVDSFQGQERDVVVVSLARSQGLGFLTDAGRMNVMLTRARHALAICLNPLAVTKNDQWRTLVEDAQQRKLYTTLPNKLCRAPTGLTDAEDEILRYIRCS